MAERQNDLREQNLKGLVIRATALGIPIGCLDFACMVKSRNKHGRSLTVRSNIVLRRPPCAQIQPVVSFFMGHVMLPFI